MSSKMTPELRAKLEKSAYDVLIRHTLLSDYKLRNDDALIPDEVDSHAYELLSDIKENIYDRTFEDNPKKNLLLCSRKTGNGKTSWAIKILKEYCLQDSKHEYHPYESEYHTAVFIPTNKYVLASKEYNEHRGEYFKMKDAIASASFIVFDDIGSAEYSRAEYTSLLSAVDDCIFENKMCIFTSNFTKDDAVTMDRMGMRLTTRIFDTSEKIEFKGQGMRN